MRVRGLGLVVMFVIGVSVFGVGSAAAATGYGDVCSSLLTGSFCTAGSFSFPAGVGVDNSASSAKDAAKGDVYVVDLDKSRVLKFDESGEPASFEATGTDELDGSSTPAGSFSTPAYIAVGPSGDIYVENVGEPVIDVFNSKGEYVSHASGAFVAPSFEGGSYAPVGVGVDQANGDVYVSDRQDGGVIDVFEEDGAWVRTFPTGAGGGDSVAVNSSGDVYVDNENASVTEFTATGTPLGTLDAVAPQAVAVDPANQSVFVGENGGSSSYQIAEYAAPAAPGEAPVAVFGNGAFASNGSYGIAVNSTTGQVYASNAAGEDGLIFEEGPTPETPVTEPASEVTPTTAMLHGELNPAGKSKTGYYFEYNKSGSCTGPGATRTIAVAEAEVEKKAVTTEVKGLEPSQHYTFCLIATTAYGRAEGSGQPLTTPAVRPSVDSESASSVHSFGASIEGQVNPNNQPTKYSFQYATSKQLTGATTIEGSPPAPTLEGYGDQLVSTTIPTGILRASTTYYYRVIAENATGTTEGTIQRFTTLPPILIDSESVANVTSTSAELQAEINPQGTDTTYYFQSGTTSCTENPVACTSIPAPPGTDIGSGETDQPASVQIRGLLPSTVYHYRVIATNTLGTVEGPDQTFTTQPAVTSSTILDGRAWEMVSPLEKSDALITGIDGEPGRVGGMPQAAADGEAMAYGSQGAFAGPAGAPLYGQYLARRGVGGWSTVNIMPPVVSEDYTLEEAPYHAFSGELSSGLLLDGGKSGEPGPVEHPPLTEGAPEGYPNFYVHELDTGTDGYRPVLTSTPSEPASEFNLEFVGTTPDLKHMVFSTGAALTPEAVRGEASFDDRNLYEWSDGQFQLVGGPRAILGGDDVGNPVGLNAISDDGSRVYFTRERSAFVRENIGTPQAKTVAVPGGEFLAASGDGSEAFLTNSGINDQGGDLYEFDLETEQTVDLAPGAEVQGVLGVSEDGSYVYFVANGVLAEGASRGECRYREEFGGPQTCNLYVWHRGTPADTIKFIATLSEDDNNEVSEKNQEYHETPDDWAPDLEDLTSRVSADGLNVVFMSDGHLTGYDNRNSETGQRMQEVYDYNAGTGVLSCVSCDPSGARPRGASYIPAGTGFGGFEATYQSRVLSDVEGRARVFFDSSDALVPQDTNGEQDVYEWEEDGRGSCRVAAGCVGLISSGTNSEASAFLDASADGDDVFFLTESRLVAQDTDNLLDVYDARAPHVPGEAVGSPAAVPVSPSCNNGDSCKPPPSAQPAIFGAPASATFTGAGNVTASSGSVAQLKSKPLTRAQKLSKALAACGRKRKARRASCRAQARKRYGSVSGLGRDKTAKGRK